MELFETKEGQRIKALERMLAEVCGELSALIGKENARLKRGISSSDLQPPEYLDYQTVHDAMNLINEK